MSFNQFLNAIKDGNLENVERLFQPEYLEFSDIYNRVPLHYACFNGSLGIVKFLLSKGFDFNSCTDFGWRPIHFACFQGNSEVVNELWQLGCDIITKGKFGETPRDLACENKRYDCIKIIDYASTIQENIHNFNVNFSLIDEKESILSPKFHDGFDKCEFLGTGSFGKVHRYLHSNTGISYAIKTIYKRKLKEDNFEKNILLYKNRLNHERILKYFDVDIKGDKIKFLMEYMEKGSLKDHIKGNEALSHHQIARFCKEILEGLAFLKKNSIIHRDVKSENILLDNNLMCKLSDFGLSRSLKTVFGSNYATTFCGDYRYMAPEVIEGKPYSYPADIWSAGVVFIEMVSGTLPYSKISPIEISNIISRTKKIEFIPIKPLSNNMKGFLNDMQGEASTRKSALDLLKDSFILYGC